MLIATLVKEIPDKRFRTLDGSKPRIGDKVMLDQGFTFEDGEPGCLVYGIDTKGSFTFEAEVYESELSVRRNSVILRNRSGLNKVQLDKGLKEVLKIGLKQAKELTEQLLKNGNLTLNDLSDEQVKQLKSLALLANFEIKVL